MLAPRAAWQGVSITAPGCSSRNAHYSRVVTRSFTRRTNFSPDQTSVSAQTFTSTSPASSPISRTKFPSKSVATPELFLGQPTHNIPAGANAFAIRENSRTNSARDLVNTITKSSAFPCFTTTHPAKASRNSAHTSAGAFANCARNPALIPNFFGRGVPEYPGIVNPESPSLVILRGCD